MRTLAAVAPCDGVLSTLPEASLCRRCQRAQPGSHPSIPFIPAKARIIDSALGQRMTCPDWIDAAKAKG